MFFGIQEVFLVVQIDVVKVNGAGLRGMGTRLWGILYSSFAAEHRIEPELWLLYFLYRNSYPELIMATHTYTVEDIPLNAGEYVNVVLYKFAFMIDEIFMPIYERLFVPVWVIVCMYRLVKSYFLFIYFLILYKSVMSSQFMSYSICILECFVLNLSWVKESTFNRFTQ